MLDSQNSSLSRRQFLTLLGSAISAMLLALCTAGSAQTGGGSQTYGYGTGKYGQGTYPGYKTYLPYVDKGKN